jgi:hypothetical protein
MLRCEAFSSYGKSWLSGQNLVGDTTRRDSLSWTRPKSSGSHGDDLTRTTRRTKAKRRLLLKTVFSPAASVLVVATVRVRTKDS